MRGIKAFIANHLGSFISMDCLEFLVNVKRAEDATFFFDNMRLEYFFHSYNNFRIRERAVEVPVIGYYLKKLRPTDVLEVGNVSSHYYTYFRELFRKPIDIVDKGENGFNVINTDIGRFSPGKKYDFIFSISTFEHMDEVGGSGERPLSVPGSCLALANMHHVVLNLLKPRGTFVLTVPIGQSPAFERCFAAGDLEKIPCRSLNIWLLRRTRELSWVEVPLVQRTIPEEPQTQKDSGFSGVNSVLVIEIKARDE